VGVAQEFRKMEVMAGIGRNGALNIGV